MIEGKLFEIRDHATNIPALAVRIDRQRLTEAERWLLARVGFTNDMLHVEPPIFLIRLADDHADPYGHGSGTRTMPVAHEQLYGAVTTRGDLPDFDDLKSGDVLDVRVALGERDEPVESDRYPESGVTP